MRTLLEPRRRETRVIALLNRQDAKRARAFVRDMAHPYFLASWRLFVTAREDERAPLLSLTNIAARETASESCSNCCVNGLALRQTMPTVRDGSGSLKRAMVTDAER